MGNRIDNISPLVPHHYDYLGIDKSGGTTDVYTYKTGGSGGTLVGTITVTFSSVAKTTITTVVRT